MTKNDASYLVKILRLFAEGKFRPGVHEIDIEHQASCAIFTGGTCDCDPEIMLVVRNVRSESDNRDD